MADVTITRPYPGGWKDLPLQLTDIDGAALDQIEANTQTVLDRANDAYVVAEAAWTAARGVPADLILYVSKNSGSDANDGLSRGTALFTIGAALSKLAGAGGVIHLSSGTFTEEFTLTDSLTVEGIGPDKTIIKAVSGSPNLGVIMSPAGLPIQNVRLAHFKIVANGNAGQSGLYLPHGTINVPPGAGLWYSEFDRLKVGAFDLHSIWCRGGGTNGLNPHQFLNFRKVIVGGGSTGRGYGFFASGQAGQIKLMSCEFDGTGIGSGGTNVRLNRECSDNLGLTIISDEHPYSVTFDNLTCQNASYGVWIDRAFPVEFVGTTYFENLYYALTAAQTAQKVVIDTAIFANASSDGAGGGYAIKAQSTSVVTARDCVIIGTVDHSYVNSGGYVIVKNAWESAAVSKTSGLTQQLGNAATIDVGSSNHAYVNGGATVITTVNGKQAPGEVIYIKAFGGSIQLGTGGNVNLSGRSSPVTIPSGQWATLIRQDLGSSAWELVDTGA